MDHSLFTLVCHFGFKPSKFKFGLLLQTFSYKLDVVYTYKLINLSIPNRCEILWDFKCKHKEEIINN